MLQAVCNIRQFTIAWSVRQAPLNGLAYFQAVLICLGHSEWIQICLELQAILNLFRPPLLLNHFEKGFRSYRKPLVSIKSKIQQNHSEPPSLWVFFAHSLSTNKEYMYLVWIKFLRWPMVLLLNLFFTEPLWKRLEVIFKTPGLYQVQNLTVRFVKCGPMYKKWFLILSLC